MSLADDLRTLKRLLTIEELAELTQLAKKTIYAKAKAGTIPATRLAGTIRFDPRLIADWLEENTVSAI